MSLMTLPVNSWSAYWWVLEVREASILMALPYEAMYLSLESLAELA